MKNALFSKIFILKCKKECAQKFFENYFFMGILIAFNLINYYGVFHFKELWWMSYSFAKKSTYFVVFISTLNWLVQIVLLCEPVLWLKNGIFRFERKIIEQIYWNKTNWSGYKKILFNKILGTLPFYI